MNSPTHFGRTSCGVELHSTKGFLYEYTLLKYRMFSGLFHLSMQKMRLTPNNSLL